MSSAEKLADTIEATFKTIQHTRMDGVPVMNTALSVRLLGLRAWNGFWLGTLLTPWFMNLILLPETPDDTPLASGTKRTFRFPSGSFEFIRGNEQDIGEFWMCSLFSPVFEFTDQETAENCAEAALTELFEDAEAPSESEAGMAAVWRGDLTDIATPTETNGQASTEAPTDASAKSSEDCPSADGEISTTAMSRRSLLTGNLSREARHEP